MLGRGAIDKGINLAGIDDLDTAGYLSRQHLLLKFRSKPPRLVATDLGSRNATTLRRWTGESLDDPETLTAAAEVTIADGSQPVLADTVRIEVSGQRYVLDTRRPDLGRAGDRATRPVSDYY